MVFDLIREIYGPTWTAGKLYIRASEYDMDEGTFGVSPSGDYYVCDTLEPAVARLASPGADVAIPEGFYGLKVSKSLKFCRQLPEVTDVVGRSGIRIHRGNTSADTKGCILVGRAVKGDPSRLWDSRAREVSLVGILLRSKTEHFLEITERFSAKR